MRQTISMKKFALGFVLACASFASAQIDPARTVMTINGEEVKGGEYYERMEFLPGVGTMRGENFIEAAPGFLVINRLIEEKLLLQVAKEQGVYPTDVEVAALYKEKADDIKDFEKNYTDAGVSRKYVENQLRLELAQFKLQTKGINLTDMEVEKHYKENPSRFTIGKRIKLSVIAVPEFKKDEVDKALGSGKGFADVAKTLSTDPTAKDGGNLGFIFDLDLSDQIKGALKDVRIGGLTPWIKGEQVVLRFHLDDIIPEQLKPLDAKMKRDLRRSLMMDKGVAKNDVEALLKDARKKAKIDVKQLQFKSEIQRMLERYKIGG